MAKQVFSQEPVFKQFTTKDGLPSNEAHFIFSDSKGYIWICTDAGIAKYNANVFKIFNTSNGMPDNTVFEVKEDKTGKIWYRTLNNNVGYIFNDSVFIIGANKIVNSFAEEGRIISFGIEDNGDVYIGKQNTSTPRFLKICSPYSTMNTTILKPGMEHHCGFDMIILKNRSIVYTEARSPDYGPGYKINILDKDLKTVLRDSINHAETSPVSHFLLFKNNLYFATKDLLVKYDLEAKSISRNKKDFRMLGFYLHYDSILMLGSVSKGIYCYSLDQKKQVAHFLNGISVTCITKDFQNGIWVSTLEKGIYYYGYEDPVKYKISQEDGNSVTGLSTDKSGNVFASFFNGNIYKLNYTGNEYVSEEKIYPPIINTNHEPINLLIHISPQKYFIGDNLGNKLYESNTKKTRKVTALAQALKCGTMYKNKLLLFSVNDFFEADTEFVHIEHVAHFKDRISGYSATENNLYVSGLKGLYKFDGVKREFIKDNRFNTRIEDVERVADKIYLATKFEGLLILNKNKIDTLSEKSGLISNICKSILVDGNDIWVSSNRGVSKITRSKNDSYEIMNYSLNYFGDAVDIREMCILNGFMFFYSGNTIYAFQTNRLNLNEQCVIKQLKVNGVVKDHLKEITLPYNASDIQITFEALFYNLKGKTNYRYKYGEEWIYTSESTVNLGSLLNGDYTFKVEALNLNNKWIPASNSVLIHVERPFWQSFYFIAGEILFGSIIISTGLFFIYRRRQKKEKEKNEMNIKMIELEAKTARLLMNPHFIFNSLNTLQRFVLEADMENAENYINKFSKLLRKLMESSTIDKISLADEIDILSKYLYIEKLRFDNSFDFKIDIKVENIETIHIPFMLIQPFVENAVWHGLMPKSGDKFLTISFIKLNNDCIRCMVEDNGVGREASALRKNALKNRSMAIELIKQRLELMQKLKGVACGFKIWDKKDENGNSTGTLVEIILPIIN